MDWFLTLTLVSVIGAVLYLLFWDDEPSKPEKFVAKDWQWTQEQIVSVDPELWEIIKKGPEPKVRRKNG
jgi:hypothetical protein